MKRNLSGKEEGISYKGRPNRRLLKQAYWNCVWSIERVLLAVEALRCRVAIGLHYLL